MESTNKNDYEMDNCEDDNEDWFGNEESQQPPDLIFQPSESAIEEPKMTR